MSSSRVNKKSTISNNSKASKVLKPQKSKNKLTRNAETLVAYNNDSTNKTNSLMEKQFGKSNLTNNSFINESNSLVTGITEPLDREKITINTISKLSNAKYSRVNDLNYNNKSEVQLNSYNLIDNNNIGNYSNLNNNNNTEIEGIETENFYPINTNSSMYTPINNNNNNNSNLVPYNNNDYSLTNQNHISNHTISYNNNCNDYNNNSKIKNFSKKFELKENTKNSKYSPNSKKQSINNHDSSFTILEKTKRQFSEKRGKRNNNSVGRKSNFEEIVNKQSFDQTNCNNYNDYNKNVYQSQSTNDSAILRNKPLFSESNYANTTINTNNNISTIPRNINFSNTKNSNCINNNNYLNTIKSEVLSYDIITRANNIIALVNSKSNEIQFDPIMSVFKNNDYLHSTFIKRFYEIIKTSFTEERENYVIQILKNTEELKEKNTELTNRNKELQERENYLKSTLDETLTSYEQDVSIRDNRINELEKELSNSNSKIINYQETVNNLSFNNKQLHDQVNLLLNEKESLVKEIHESNNNKFLLEEKLKDAEKNNNEYYQTITNYSNENQTLNRRLKEISSSDKKQSEKIKELEQSINMLKGNLNEKHNEVLCLEDKLENVNNEMENFKIVGLKLFFNKYFIRSTIE